MPFLIALAISTVLHGAAITLPGWELPGFAEPEPPAIEAQLVVPQRPASPAASAALEKPRPARPPAAPRSAAHSRAAATTPVTTPAGEAPVHTEPPLPASAPALVAAEPPIAAPAPVAPPSVTPPFASRGRMRYRVTYGEDGFVVGETTQEWSIDADRYTLTSVAEPRGLAALRGKTRRQESAGEITAAGLRPLEFRDTREGRAQEIALFDWSAGRIALAGGREAVLTAGAQDMLSVFYQLAWLSPRQGLDFAVATTTRLGRSSFEWLGEETLDLPAGSQSTLHLRSRSGNESTEVWLAPALGGLPVKIRHVDRKGDVFDQSAELMELH